MQCVVMGEEEVKKIKSYLRNAELNIVSEDQMIAISEGQIPPAGDTHAIYIDNGYRIVYTEEVHPQKDQKGKLVKHISISYKGGDQIPSIHAFNMFLEVFEFRFNTNNGARSGEFTISEEELNSNIINAYEVKI